MNLRELTMEEVVYVYDTYMLDDFGADEVKPIERMMEMKERDAYSMYGLYDGERMMAYAFLCGDPSQKVVLLDYLAVMKEARGQGFGSMMLKKLGEELPLGGLMIESEDVSMARDSEDAAVRAKRMEFYYKAGAHDTVVKAALWGVHYQVLYLPYSMELTKEEEYEHLERIYLDMFNEYHREKYAFWHRTDAE